MSGFVKSQRDRFSHPLFRSEKFCRGYAWDWLVANACWKPQQADISGKLVLLERGQLCFSIRYLAAAWGWDKAAVSRFLTRLKTEAMIETHADAGQTVVTICNYDKYQSDASPSETERETESETAARQQRDKEEERKERKEKNSVTEQPDLLSEEDAPKVDLTLRAFDEFWSVYPKKVGKKEALTAFKRAVNSGANSKEIISGAEEFANSVIGKDRQYIKNPQGWLTDERWKSEADPEIERQREYYRRIREQALEDERNAGEVRRAYR